MDDRTGRHRCRPRVRMAAGAPRSPRAVAACCLVLAALVCGGTALANDERQARGADPGVRPAGDLDLTRYRGSVVVVHFWATWCKPCLEEIPSLIRFHARTYPELRDRGRGLRLVLISRDVRRSDLERFLAERDHPFPVYFDPRGQWMQRLGVPAVPATVIVGPDSRVLKRTLGTHDWQDEQWLSRLREATRR